jgi:hypothetical protein
MPYPESCPECGGAFRNTGTHFTARRNEVGRHVLLELGCQNTSRRFWWNFSSGKLHDESALVTSNGLARPTAASTNGHASVATLERPAASPSPEPNGTAESPEPPAAERPATERIPAERASTARIPAERIAAAPTPSVPAPTPLLSVTSPPVEVDAERETVAPPESAPSLKEAFLRQLQLDRLTLRQMRSLLMADEARRAIEVAAGATEATYERLALILFGTDLAQLAGKQAPPPASPGLSAEERLELQREKARIRARLRRAAIKAAKQQPG